MTPATPCYYGTEPLHDIAVLGGRIQQVHVKEMGAPLLGDGDVPWDGDHARLARGGVRWLAGARDRRHRASAGRRRL